MNPKTRLQVSLIIVGISAIFGALVLFERPIADDIALWYVPTVLTLIFLSHYWKRGV